jgi:hypothetical protein
MTSGTDASAALEICADGTLVVSSRIYNQLSDDHVCSPNGTLGQRLEGAESADGLAAGEVAVMAQLRENDAFRSHIGFTNTSSEPARLEVSLLDATGSVLDVLAVDLGPSEWVQVHRPLRNLVQVGGLDAASARVEVETGSGVFAYASVIDNATNDATTVPMRRVVVETADEACAGGCEPGSTAQWSVSVP